MIEPPERRDVSGPRECDHRYRWAGGWQCRFCGHFADEPAKRQKRSSAEPAKNRPKYS